MAVKRLSVPLTSFYRAEVIIQGDQRYRIYASLKWVIGGLDNGLSPVQAII